MIHLQSMGQVPRPRHRVRGQGAADLVSVKVSEPSLGGPSGPKPFAETNPAVIHPHPSRPAPGGRRERVPVHLCPPRRSTAAPCSGPGRPGLLPRGSVVLPARCGASCHGPGRTCVAEPVSCRRDDRVAATGARGSASRLGHGVSCRRRR